MLHRCIFEVVQFLVNLSVELNVSVLFKFFLLHLFTYLALVPMNMLIRRGNLVFHLKYFSLYFLYNGLVLVNYQLILLAKLLLLPSFCCNLGFLRDDRANVTLPYLKSSPHRVGVLDMVECFEHYRCSHHFLVVLFLSLQFVAEGDLDMGLSLNNAIVNIFSLKIVADLVNPRNILPVHELTSNLVPK